MLLSNAERSALKPYTHKTKTGPSAFVLHICAHACIYMYVTTIIKEKEATRSPTLKEDMGRDGGTKRGASDIILFQLKMQFLQKGLR